MTLFAVDPDISKAHTLHTSFYTNPEIFEISKEKIFAPSWQFIGSVESVQQPGDMYPLDLLPGYLNEPLLLTRDKENELHCLSNVCTHRGSLLIDSPCNHNHVRCRYHGRIFKLNGQLQSMPEFKEVQNFPAAQDDLAQLKLFRWGNFLFTSLNPLEDATVYFEDMINRMQWLPLQAFHYRPELDRTYEVNAHWALYCENYLEGFHIPFVHADLNAVIDYGSYTTELFRYSNLQIGMAKDKEDCFPIPEGADDFRKKIAAYYFWIFPNTMFNFYPWGLSVNIVQPVSIDRTIVKFLTYMYDETKYRQGAGGDLDKVELEDEAIVQSVQRGIRSRFYSQGRYSVTREQGTHHFHQLLSAAIIA